MKEFITRCDIEDKDNKDYKKVGVGKKTGGGDEIITQCTSEKHWKDSQREPWPKSCHRQPRERTPLLLPLFTECSAGSGL